MVTVKNISAIILLYTQGTTKKKRKNNKLEALLDLCDNCFSLDTYCMYCNVLISSQPVLILS